MINEDDSFESQEEIQRKYDQMDQKELAGSLNDEWIKKFEDIQILLNDEGFPLDSDAENPEEQKNNAVFTRKAFDLGTLPEISEIVKENDQIKYKEQVINDEFEKLKKDFERISKEERLVENKVSRKTLFFESIYPNRIGKKGNLY